MNNVDCVIKRDVYPQKMHSCSKNIHGMSVFVLKIWVVYQKNYMVDIAWIISKEKMDLLIREKIIAALRRIKPLFTRALFNHIYGRC